MHPGNLPIDLFVFDRVPGLDGCELDVLDDGFFVMLYADTLRIDLRPVEIVGKHVPESHLPVEATSAYA